MKNGRVNGTHKVLQWMQAQGMNPDAFIVGEPSSKNELAAYQNRPPWQPLRHAHGEGVRGPPRLFRACSKIPTAPFLSQ